MGVQTATISALSDDADGYAQSQSLAGAGSLTLNGALVSSGVGSSSAAQPVTITSAADDSGIDFTVTGTYGGLTVSETIDGANAGAATTTQVFDTVTEISADGATTGNVTAGPVASNGAASKILPSNWRSSDYKAALAIVLSSGATLTYKVQHTLDDVQSSAVSRTWLDHDSLTAQTANADGNYAFPVKGYRLFITAYTSGSATLTGIEN